MVPPKTMHYSRQKKATVARQLGSFAGLEVPDQPAAPPHVLLFIKPVKQCFSLTQPASFSQVSDQRTGPIKKRAEGTYLAGGGADDDCESATTLDSHGRPIADNVRRGGGARASAMPMAAGAGLVHPQQALDPG